MTPDGGAIQGRFPRFGAQVTHAHRSALGALHRALGATPLWLGPRYRGKPLGLVEVGTFAARGRNRKTLRPAASFIRLHYGGVLVMARAPTLFNAASAIASAKALQPLASA